MTNEGVLSQPLALFYASVVKACCDNVGDATLSIGGDVAVTPDALAVISANLGSDATLCMRGVTHVHDREVDALAEFTGCLSLPDLQEFPERLARALAKSNASVTVSERTAFDPSALEELVRTAGDVYLECPEVVLAQDGPAILRHATCRLHLRLQVLSDEFAAQIAHSKCSMIRLYGGVACSLSDAAAAALAQFAGKLSIDIDHWGAGKGCAALASKLVKEYKHWDSQSLAWSSKTISPAVASVIVGRGHSNITLGIEDMDDDVASRLAAYRGALSLTHRGGVSASAAKKLAGKEGPGGLALMCETLDSQAVEALAGCRVPLRLPGLKAMTKKTAQLLAHVLTWDGSNAEELGDANLYRENLSRLKRLVLSDESMAWSALPGNVGMCHPDLELVSIERCHGLKVFDFRGRANASPRPEPPLAIRLVDCAAVDSITLLTERHCAKGLEFRELPKCKEVCISTPDLEDLRSLVELGSVESLVVQSCPRLSSLDGIASLTQLTSLTLTNCPELASVAGVEALAKLSQLSVNDCGKLASLDALAAMPELTYIELRGATSIKSLHGYRSRDGVSFFIESEGVGVPPSLVKTYFDNDGANCLGHFEKAIIECASCGGTKFRGRCHGWYERVHFAEVERCGELVGDDLVSSSKRQLVALEAELRSDGLEGVEGARGQDFFPVLHADVTCVTCKAILDPASIGARPEMDGNWSEVGKERSIKGIAQPKPEIRLEFDVARPEGEHVGPEAGKCPICCEAVLQIAVSGVARSESGGKFSGHVEIDRDTWGDLPECFHIDESNEKADGAWRWLRAPRAASGGHVTCERGCFRAFVAAPEQVPAVLLAVLAAFETSQTAPDVARLATWIRGLGSDADSPANLVEAAVGHLEALDPEMVPSVSPDANPVELANACRQKAKALMEQALPESMKAPAATRAKRPSAKKAAKSAPAKKGVSKKSSAASAAVAVPPSQGLQGRVFCFTGRLTGMSRAEAEAKVVALGAKTADSITKKVTDVVVGEGAGSKREKAEKLGLRVFDQAAFESLIDGKAAH